MYAYTFFVGTCACAAAYRHWFQWRSASLPADTREDVTVRLLSAMWDGLSDKFGRLLGQANLKDVCARTIYEAAFTFSRDRPTGRFSDQIVSCLVMLHAAGLRCCPVLLDAHTSVDKQGGGAVSLGISQRFARAIKLRAPASPAQER